MVNDAIPADALEEKIVRKGREIFALMAGAQPWIFSRTNITGRLMEWSMSREQLKVQLFRLIDVLPALNGSREVAQHARDYLGAERSLPGVLRLGLAAGAGAPGLLSLAARVGVRQMAGNFILAPDTVTAIPKLRRLREKGLAFTADILGETVLSEYEAVRYQERCLQLVADLADAAVTWTDVASLDYGGAEPIPRANVSVKISALYSQVHPEAPEEAIDQ